MKICPSCGKEVKENSLYCQSCGAKIENDKPHNSVNYEPLTQEDFEDEYVGAHNTVNYEQATESDFKDMYEGAHNSTNYYNQPKDNFYDLYYNAHNTKDYDIMTEDDLINAYIGANANEIRKERLSICTFLLGIIYTSFRKMWSYSLIYLALFIATLYQTSTIITVVCIIIHIALSFRFNKKYVEKVRREIDKIKMNNIDKKDNELIEICKKKGGFNYKRIFAYICIFYFLIGYLAENGYDDIKKMLIGNNETNENSIDDLNYNIPSLFKEGSYSYDTYKTYEARSDDYSCYITITSDNIYEEDFDVSSNLNDYINKYMTSYDTYSGISHKNINNTNWYYANTKSSTKEVYYYETLSKDKQYTIEFTNYKYLYTDSYKCDNALNEFINSLEVE